MMKTLLLPTIIVAIALGCSEPEESKTVVLIDKTVDTPFNQSDQLISLLNNIKSGEVTFSSIDDLAIGFDTTVTKPFSSYLNSNLKKEAEVEAAFLQGIKQGLQKVSVIDRKYNKSYVFAKISHFSSKLARSDFSRRSVILVSDGVEHNDVASFYRFVSAPKHLMENYDDLFFSLESEFSEIKGLQLSGIHFIFLYSPDNQEEAFFRECRKFWTKYLSEKGGTVEFKTQL